MLGYLQWDPSPALFNFNLPLLGRPVLWYGFLFAFGFFLGYVVLLYLLRRYFLLSPAFNEKEILSWGELLSRLQADSLMPRLKWRSGQPVSAALKTEVLSELNTADVSASLPVALLSRFARAKFASVEALQRRLSWEKRLRPIVLTLKQRAKGVAEAITLYVVLGALIGARLGDVLFYQNWQEIARHPATILAFWEGGLASHGGALGILLALLLFAKRKGAEYQLTFLKTLDLAVIPTALAAVLIRLGNFMNQEILGTPTTLPWGVIFMHPAGGEAALPRHPVQLYEALGYFCIFLFLFYRFHRLFPVMKTGRTTGLFLILVFAFRFAMEFFKTEQSAHLMHFPLTMGQLLSIPLIVWGFCLALRRHTARRRIL